MEKNKNNLSCGKFIFLVMVWLVMLLALLITAFIFLDGLQKAGLNYLQSKADKLCEDIGYNQYIFFNEQLACLDSNNTIHYVIQDEEDKFVEIFWKC